MWIELGIIFGCTVSEVQDRLSADEFWLWFEYRHRYGSLNPAKQATYYGALNAFFTLSTNSKKPVKLKTLLPPNWYEEKDEEVRPFTADDIRAIAAAMKATRSSAESTNQKLYKVVRKQKD